MHAAAAGALAALVGLGILQRRRARRAMPLRVGSGGNAAARAAQAPASAAAIEGAPNLPEVLRTFRWRRADELEAPVLQLLTRRLRAIGRPPHALYRLMSPQTLAQASSRELSELARTEPLLAARVLGIVNSAFYGLRQPVASLGHAITYLGLNAFRGLCLQYAMEQTFTPTSREQALLFDEIWRACALAVTQCAQMAQRLGLPEPAALVSEMVLYFVGQIAVCLLAPPAGVVALHAGELPQRLRAEQELIGINAAEVGALMLRAWELPPALVDAVRDIDRVFDTPAAAFAPERAARLAVCHLSARLAEDSLAQRSQPLDEMLQGPRAELFHLRGYLALPQLRALMSC